jgi:hypothetical protein
MEPEVSLPHSQVPATFSILSQLNPVHTPTSYFLKIRLIFIRLYKIITNSSYVFGSNLWGHQIVPKHVAEL